MSFASTKKFCTVNDDGLKMAYVEQSPEKETTLVFLHGNPMSSFLWRNVMEPLKGKYRLIAPDLIGMGDSDKLANANEVSYRIVDHVEYLDSFLDSCALPMNGKTVLVIHDWGSALGFWWAYRNSERVQGIAYMESMVAPLFYSDFDAPNQEFFKFLRSPAGESAVLTNNFFIEQGIPEGIIRNLTEAEMDEYRRPFLEAGESRRPTLTFPREVPLNGTPADVADIVQTYSDWMGENDIPKLLINAEPGVLLTGRPLALARSWKNQVEVTVPGLHFIQEDSPEEVAEAIEEWLETLPLSTDDTTSATANHHSPSVQIYLVLSVAMLLLRKMF